MQTNDDYNISYEFITEYIRNTISKKTGIFSEMEEYAKINDVPIAQPETIKLIETLVLSSGAKSVLEIGSAIGYSSISLASLGVNVTTIERNEDMICELEKNIEKANVRDKITVHKGDASEILDKLTGEYDFVFVDAAKGQYLEFLPNAMRLLKKGGILFSDNILYKGMVATDDLFQRRKITIIKRLRAYLDEICSREDLHTAIIPIGDGCAISYKKGEINK